MARESGPAQPRKQTIRKRRHEESRATHESVPKLLPPTSISEELIQEFEGYVREGNALTTCAQLATVSERTFEMWMREGRKADNEPYTTFRRRIVHAKASIERQLVAQLVNAGDPKIILEWLRRRNKQQWDPTTKTETKLTLSASKLSTEALTKLVHEAAGLSEPETK